MKKKWNKASISSRLLRDNPLKMTSGHIGDSYFFISLKYQPQTQGDMHFHYL
ncbi:hypothetical protein ACA086_09880 [Muriicola sp. E247]|uniref:hypothetical protein n=1 Tax=Muriicola sp. E247 TaxID=3242730 RepID=UPI003524659E